jgi:uncharacterized protein DUF4112
VAPAGTPRGAQDGGRPVLEPEVLPPESRWIERIAWLMDRSIPLGRRWSVGLDAIIGLVPGVGDIAGILVGAAIVGAAIKARLPRSAIARMVANVAVDGLFGAVPFLGDVFDMVFKANTRNVEIFREAVRGRYEPVRDSSFAAGVAIAFLLILAVPILLIVLLIRAFGLL